LELARDPTHCEAWLPARGRIRTLSHTPYFEVTPVSKVTKLKPRQRPASALDTPTDLSSDAVAAVSKALNTILADSYALYLKTKNFHWHVSGPNFRDYHLLFDEQAAAILANTDDVAERVRKIGGITLKSIGQISKQQTIDDNEDEFVAPSEMLRELMNDHKTIIKFMRQAHGICDDHEDIATASLIENWIDEAEKRLWFLFEAGRSADRGGH
jgi:starvation-inducible DNA-binding protein